MNKFVVKVHNAIDNYRIRIDDKSLRNRFELNYFQRFLTRISCKNSREEEKSFVVTKNIMNYKNVEL